MERKLKIKYWFWAIVVFGMIGIYMPIIARAFQGSDNLIILKETVFNITTYSISILVTSIYTIILNTSDGSIDFNNKLLDNIGLIISALAFVLLVNFLFTLDINFYIFWGLIVLSLIACIVAWFMWFKANRDENFGTSPLGGGIN